jgi:hypothetical protein
VASANMDLVRSIYAARARGHFDAGWADPQIEFIIADGPDPAMWKGLTGTEGALRDQLDAW